MSRIFLSAEDWSSTDENDGFVTATVPAWTRRSVQKKTLCRYPFSSRPWQNLLPVAVNTVCAPLYLAGRITSYFLMRSVKFTLWHSLGSLCVGVTIEKMATMNRNRLGAVTSCVCLVADRSTPFTSCGRRAINAGGWSLRYPMAGACFTNRSFFSLVVGARHRQLSV